MTGDPWGATYRGDGSRYSASQQRAMEREAEEQEAVTAVAETRLYEWREDDGTTMCVCGAVLEEAGFEAHAESCRALRREVA